MTELARLVGIEEATPVDTDVPPMTHQGLKEWIEQKQWELITGHRVEKDRK